MKNLLIRKATLQDFEAIIALSDALTHSDLPYDKEIEIDWPHTENGKNYYQQKITQANGVCYVADLKGEIVGYFTAAEKEVPSYRLVKVAELENIYVDEKVRNEGIGKSLMETFLTWAKETGAQKASANSFSANQKAIAFYQREGFQSFETILEKPIT